MRPFLYVAEPLVVDAHSFPIVMGIEGVELTILKYRIAGGGKRSIHSLPVFGCHGAVLRLGGDGVAVVYDFAVYLVVSHIIRALGNVVKLGGVDGAEGVERLDKLACAGAADGDECLALTYF